MKGKLSFMSRPRSGPAGRSPAGASFYASGGTADGAPRASRRRIQHRSPEAESQLRRHLPVLANHKHHLGHFRLSIQPNVHVHGLWENVHEQKSIPEPSRYEANHFIHPFYILSVFVRSRTRFVVLLLPAITGTCWCSGVDSSLSDDVRLRPA